MRALVLEGIVRESLAVTRSLGRQGIDVHVGDPHAINPARFSKYCSKFYKYPDPKTDLNLFAEWLIHHVKENKYDMVFPLNDYTYEVCTKHQETLNKYTKVAVNDWETFELARDKAKTLEFAKKAEVPMPETWVPSNDEDLEKIDKEWGQYPILLKPAKSSGSRGVKIVHSLVELKSEFKTLTEKYGKMLVQEFIPGKEILDVPLVFNLQGEVRAGLVNNRIRMYPANGGPNVAGCAINDPKLRDHAINLMKDIGWKGAGLVEFKVDERTGEAKLMEINPRFWGSTQLGISAGVDWPRLLFDATVKGDCEKVFEYEEGIVVRWLLPGELMHFLTVRPKKSLFPGFFKFFGPKVDYYVFKREDMGPILGLFLTILVQATNPKILKYYLWRKS